LHCLAKMPGRAHSLTITAGARVGKGFAVLRLAAGRI
jgi:hypothetical protein